MQKHLDSLIDRTVAMILAIPNPNAAVVRAQVKLLVNTVVVLLQEPPEHREGV